MAADILVENHRSVGLSIPMTRDAHQWIEEHVKIEPWQRIECSVACEARYLRQLVNGMQDDGLVVE